LKRLVLDIETAPTLAYVWRFFKENIGAAQVLEHSSILCWSAKWVGEKQVFYEDAWKQTEKSMLRKLVKLLNEADAVIGHNSAKFDMPKIRGRCLVHGIKPAQPYKDIDTCLTARKEFGFESNSLDYLSRVLEVTTKSKHSKFPGFSLWEQCLKGNPKAWAEMKKYNIQDIQATEDVYLAMLPYMTRHPNWGVFEESDHTLCPKCGSDNIKKDGFHHTSVGKYQQYQCNDCGGWMKSRYNLYDKDKRKALVTNG